ncbi:hypothetical protein ACFFUB_09380 [Algimonas porphyrae]|uniref:Uncharacterized protein n=1 Tax=Algimonas porphyrae TaxID=1128113 RepID=A0ABQ5V4M8_9PROT|nr:hypothetical protein [Algimonas porphyrae]GLQ21674.1 hypothetical protein GCM10007854_26290 [Algimonas porphyrae]
MILRRIKAHVENENWFAVGVDFAIVVIGVFIGLQLGNWNEARAERAMERQYVIQLLDDMQSSRTMIEGRNQWLAQQVDDQRSLLDVIEICEVSPADQAGVARALSSLGKYVFAIVDRQLIDQLSASGQFSILQNIALQEGLNGLTRQSDNQMRSESLFAAQSVPFVNQARHFYYFDSDEGVDSDPWETWENLRFDLEQACKDPEFITAIGNTRETTHYLHRWNEQILGQVKALEAILEVEIEARGWRDTP